MQAAPTIEQLDPQHFMTGAYLYKDVQAYAALGEHRTASEVDRKTSQWLRQQLEGFGFSARLSRSDSFYLSAPSWRSTTRRKFRAFRCGRRSRLSETRALFRLVQGWR